MIKDWGLVPGWGGGVQKGRIQVPVNYLITKGTKSLTLRVLLFVFLSFTSSSSGGVGSLYMYTQSP